MTSNCNSPARLPVWRVRRTTLSPSTLDLLDQTIDQRALLGPAGIGLAHRQPWESAALQADAGAGAVGIRRPVPGRWRADRTAELSSRKSWRLAPFLLRARCRRLPLALGAILNRDELLVVVLNASSVPHGIVGVLEHGADCVTTFRREPSQATRTIEGWQGRVQVRSTPARPGRSRLACAPVAQFPNTARPRASVTGPGTTAISRPGSACRPARSAAPAIPPHTDRHDDIGQRGDDALPGLL